MAVGQNPENRESRDFTPFLGILKCANLEFSGIHIMKSRDSTLKVSAVGNLWFSLECISRESIITADSLTRADPSTPNGPIIPELSGNLTFENILPKKRPKCPKLQKVLAKARRI